MTPDDLARLIEQYRAGIVAELNLLKQLAAVSHKQNDGSRSRDFGKLSTAADSREELMRSLVMIEEGLRAVRQSLTEHRAIASRLPGFDEVAALHRDAAQLIGSILSTDQESLAALADAEFARRSAFANLERGESTLAAYRRVLSPPVASATLFNKKG
jgi:hypothetical protein